MSQLDLWRKSFDPFRDFGMFPRAMDRWFEDMYSPQFRQKMDKMVISPNVEVSETRNMYTMRFDVPGMTRDDIKIDLHENTLTVSGERKEERREDDKEKKTHLSEVYYGSFSRSFTFPEAVDAEKCEAKYESGVLTLNISKKETKHKRQITIR